MKAKGKHPPKKTVRGGHKVDMGAKPPKTFPPTKGKKLHTR